MCGNLFNAIVQERTRKTDNMQQAESNHESWSISSDQRFNLFKTIL